MTRIIAAALALCLAAPAAFAQQSGPVRPVQTVQSTKILNQGVADARVLGPASSGLGGGAVAVGAGLLLLGIAAAGGGGGGGGGSTPPSGPPGGPTGPNTTN